MHTVRRSHRGARAALAATALVLAAPVFAQQSLYVLTTNNQLGFAADGAPSQAAATLSTVTGLTAGDMLVGIDTRPLNGRLYGLGFNSLVGSVTLYHLSYNATGSTATPIGNVAAFAVGVTGPDFGFDFNPTVDRVRVVTSSGQNFRINPNTGAPIDGDGATPGVQMDGAITGSTGLAGTAYTNASLNATVTTQYTLSAADNALYIQNPPNVGTQTSPLPITLDGLPLDIGGEAGFDIPAGVDVGVSNAGATGSAFAALTVDGVSGLYRVQLQDGVASFAGTFGAAAVRDIALGPAGGTALALAAPGTALVRFKPESAATTVTVPVSNVTAGETLVGIDARASTGQVFGFGVNAAADTGTLYLIDPQGGAATAIGTPGAIAFTANGVDALDLAATAWGFDFNPSVDRLRVVNGNGLNFRLNPVTGAAVDTDANTAGNQPDTAIGAAGVVLTGAAYTNNFAGATVTTLYTLDALGNRIFIQDPANSGQQVNGRLVTLAGNALDFSEVAGFDIPVGVNTTATGADAPGLGYANLTVGGGTLLYGIELSSGIVRQFLGPIGNGTTAFDGLIVFNAPGFRLFANGFED